ncbi:MAG: ATP-dependent DNA ligase [Terriglobales bacterium]
MEALAATAEAIAGTTKKSEKTRLLAEYFRSCSVEEAAQSAVLLSGRVFPAWEETTLNVGGALIWQVLKDLTGKADSAITGAYRKHGDLGSAAGELLGDIKEKSPGKPKDGLPGAPRGLPGAPKKFSVADVALAFRQIATVRGPAAKGELVLQLLSGATPLEAKYLVKFMTGELRIGLKESLVEEAIAKAYEVPLAEVQRANMLLGDIGETLKLASAGRLASARMRVGHPIGFMLASPVESAEEAFDYFQHGAVEDKYDGIRAQGHVSHQSSVVGRQEKQVRLFSRTLDNITSSFPELVGPLSGFTEDVILDGEIVAWRSGRALPFSELQRRLGRKTITEKIMREVPVAYVVFDVLYADNELVLDRPLRERHTILDVLFATARHPKHERLRDAQGTLQFEPAIEEHTNTGTAAVIRAPVLRADSSEELARMFDEAQARGNEGLMIKDLASAYAPGRRGKSWLKLKRELATLDVVVTAVEWGHGKRAKVLSDYTFAVADGGRLVNVGKAYSGLTDKEIAEMTRWFLEHTVEDHGFWREVEPKIVIEVAFNAVMESDRHNSGYALRFPRIVRLRPDKLPGEIDTLERVREIFERQKLAYPNAG